MNIFADKRTAGHSAFDTILLCYYCIMLPSGSHLFGSMPVNTWEGTSSEEVSYRYTVNIDFQGLEEASLNVHIPQNVNTPLFNQTRNSYSLQYSIDPVSEITETGPCGDTYIHVEWVTPLDSVRVTLEAHVNVWTAYGPFFSSAPYPIPEQRIPDSVLAHLQPTFSCQSDAPEIKTLADSLVSGCTSEADAAIRIINWVRYNMKWICTCSMPFIYGDAVNTLRYGGGNCVNFGNLSVALLRAAGIPARETIGPMIHEWTASCGHRWCEVFYPDRGWIPYETAYWMPNEGPLTWTFLPSRRIQTYSGSGIGLTSGAASEEHTTSTVIQSAPVPVKTASIMTDTSDFISPLITVCKPPDEEDNTVLLSAESSSEAWLVSLSQDSVYFNPNGPWEDTRDIVATIAVPPGVTPDDTATITIHAVSKKTGNDEQVTFAMNFVPSGSHAGSTGSSPAGFVLYQNHPNPANPSTLITYRLEQQDHVTLKIYNTRGQEIETLIHEFQPAGGYKIPWRPQGLPSGIYLYRLQAGAECSTKKLILQK